MEITQNQLHIIRHSLGVGDDGRGRSYRNYYCEPIDFESDGLADLRKLVALGLMKEGRIINEGRDQYFIVTEAGIAESLKRVEPLPKLTRSQRNYRAYLKSECNESFIEFLRNPYWSEYRRRVA